MYAAAVDVFAPVKLISKFAMDIPKLKPPIVKADGPRLLNTTSIPLAEDPAAVVTDCTETITSARAVVGLRRQAVTPPARTNPSRRYLPVKLILDFTTSSNLR